MARRRRPDRSASRPASAHDRPVASTPEAVDLVNRLGALLAELGLSGIEVTVGDLHVRVERASGGAASAPTPAPAGTSSPPASVVADVPAEALVTIEAPMVGTFYRAASPTAEPYVREGDVIKEGQVLCIIEAMKLMNEIEAKTAGRVAKALVENGQPVEYGQPLFLIDPLR
jgi:acetyl-CoA carboxylase biotin carboxyl carrier protein